MERRGSLVLPERRSSTGNDSTPESVRRTARANVAPLVPRFSRANIASPGRSSHSSTESLLLEAEVDKPSPTALRLRSLARSVRAVNSLGALKVRKRYLASAPTAAAGSTSQPNDSKPTPQKASGGQPVAATNLPSTRVIVLPTHEFSTREMKFLLEPLEPALPTTGWNVLDALAPSPSSPSPPPLVSRPSSAVLSGAGAKTARSGSVVPNNSSSGKGRWKTLKNASNTSENNPTATSQTSPTLRREHSHSAGAKHTRRSSVTNNSLTEHAASGPIDDTAIASVNVEARLCCARSLYKLSCQNGCELSIIHGGAISELAEFSDIEHLHLHELCAATLANLTTEPSATDAFVAHNGIPALLELSWSPSITVKLMCATALCRLSSRSIHAAALARARASIEFVSMMSLPSEQLQKLAISCIVNLVYYGHSFPERIFLGDPHAMQSQLGILSITSQLALAPQTMQFAAEMLFNLALYRTSCSGVLRGGGADILHGLAIQVGRTLDEHHFTSSSNSLLTQQTPRMMPGSAMTLLRLIAHTLANFSVHTEFQSLASGSAMKTLALLLSGALRDLGSRLYGVRAEERLRILAVPISRTLANLSSSDEQRKHGFTSDMVQLTTKLFLVNRSKLFHGNAPATRLDEKAFARNILRAIVNLSFYEPCVAHFMEFPDVVPRLVKVALRGKQDSVEEEVDENESDDNGSEEDDAYDDDESNDSHAVDSPGSTDDAPAALEHEMREDALIAILNLAQHGAYSHELLKHVDGKRLASAADEQERGSRLKYVYDVVLCNLLFENRLQQLVYGDSVVHSLIDGFYFFSSSLQTGGATGSDLDPFTADGGSRDAHAFQHENLAFPDDQERFLVALAIVAGEIVDARNIDRLVTLVLDCMRPMDTTMTPAQRKWRRNITGNAAAVLYTLAQSSATRDHASSPIYAPETVQALVDICEGRPTAVTSGEPNGARHFSYSTFAQAFSAATLYHVCATGRFDARVIQALVSACNSNEESLSLLACSAAFAIISFTPEGRQQLVASANLAKALNRLGRTSHVECQQYAAIAACNVSTLSCIWSSTELKDFIVVALLRANSVQAKQIHAKTLANMLSHIKTRAKSVDDGVLYALMKLSQVTPPSGATPETPSSDHGHLHRPAAASPVGPSKTHDDVFHLGLQVLFNLSCEYQYHQKLMGNGVIAYLATAITSSKQPATSDTKAELTRSHTVTVTTFATPEATAPPPLHATVSSDSRRYAMGIICNLSSYESNHKELMNAQVMDIIRSYVERDVETRASAAMAVRNLSCRQPWVEMICDRRTLHMLITFTQCDHTVVRHFAIQALANCSQVTDLLHLFGELKVTRAVMAVLESIKNPKTPNSPTAPASPPPLCTTKSLVPASPSLADSRETSVAALKYLHNVAFDDALALNLMEETAILRLQQFAESRELDTCENACTLAVMMLSVLAGKPRCAEALLRQRVVGFCALLHRKHPVNTVIAYETCLILVKLSTYQPIQAALTDTQAIHVVVTICNSPCACADPRIRECGAIAIRNLTLCVAEHRSLFDDDDSFEDEAPLQTTTTSHSQRQLSAGPDRSCRRHPDTSDATVSRLTERHLMQGVQHFQHEIDLCLSQATRPETCDTTHDERILMEACAGITNLSTVKPLRGEMVRAGVVTTLVRLIRANHENSGLSVPPLVTSMCSATLHRLALEEEATVDGYGLLVPSLLEILQHSDDGLHHVRYECEKVSFPSRSTTISQCPTPSVDLVDVSSSPESGADPKLPVAPGKSKVSTSTDAVQCAMIATTTCVKQTYREPKWITYIVKAMLSSATMVPHIDKKHIRAIGQPKLSFLDTDTSTLFASQPLADAADDSATAKRKGGYLLSVHMDKFTAHLAACLQDGETGLESASTPALSFDLLRQQLSTGRSSLGGATARDASHDREALVHSRKFDRHMRLTRRNHRRTKVLPVVSFL